MNDGAQGANVDQAEFWNSGAGRKWVDLRDPIEAMLAPMGVRLLELADPRPGERALDIGCGTGATTLSVADRVGPDGRVVGLDISRVLLGGAEERSVGVGNVEYLLADAQTHALEAGAFDLLISRFGVMFFADPVLAFRNMARALRPGGRMVFVAWAAMAVNPWFVISRDAAVARLGPPPPADPLASGPFAFADIDRVVGIMRDGGLAECAGVEERLEIRPGGLAHAAELAGNMGPAARLLKHYGGGADDVRAIGEDVTEALSRHVVDGMVTMPVRVNYFSAVRTQA